MNSNWFKYLILMSSLEVILAGCSVSASTPQLKQPTSSTIVQPAQINTPTPLPTHIPAQSRLTETATPLSKTFTPTPSPTPTIQPTLMKTEIEAAVRDLLRTNGNCTPPCFWGITPGVTSYDMANKFFLHMGHEGLVFTNTEGEIYLHSYHFAVEVKQGYIHVEIELKIQKRIVEAIEVIILDFEGVDPEDWEAYSLKNMLEAYGAPSKVLVFLSDSHLSPPPGSPIRSKTSYNHAVIFDQSNTAIYYFGGESIDISSTYRVCPANPERVMGIWFYIGKNPYEKLKSAIDFSETLMLTLPNNEDFYNLFVEGNEQTCLSLKAEDFQPVVYP